MEPLKRFQLHGDRKREEQIRLASGRRAGKGEFKAVGITDGRQLDAWKESSADYLLLDGGYGEMGRCFDWSVAEKAKA